MHSPCICTWRKDAHSKVVLRTMIHYIPIVPFIRDCKRMRWTDNRWTVQATEWLPRGWKHSWGKQRIRWNGEIENFTGIKWNQLAQDRMNWRSLGETFVLQSTRTAWEWWWWWGHCSEHSIIDWANGQRSELGSLRNHTKAQSKNWESSNKEAQEIARCLLLMVSLSFLTISRMQAWCM